MSSRSQPTRLGVRGIVGTSGKMRPILVVASAQLDRHSRADFVGVLLKVARVGETPTAKVPRTPFRMIEGGAD